MHPKEFLAKLEKSENPARMISRSSFGLRGGYRSGRLDQTNWEHNPAGIGENTAIREANDLSDRRQRDNYRNISLAKRITHVLRDLIVGCGLQCFIDPIQLSLSEIIALRNAQDNDKLLKLIDFGLDSDQAFLRWATDPELCDKEGRKNFFQMQRLGISEQINVGVCLVAHEFVDRGKGVSPLRLQMYEKEQVDVTRDNYTATKGENRIINGFVFDSNNREIGVYLHNEHPQESLTGSRWSYTSKFVPKKRYQHVYNPTRPNQLTGFTWHHTQGQPMRDRDMFLGDEIRTATKQARQVIAAYLDDPANTDIGFELDSTQTVPEEVPTLSYSPVAYKLKAGSDEKIEMIETKRPNPNANNFYDLIDHDIAIGSDLSYPTLHGRFNGHTYEGIRGALQLENVQMKPLQQAFGLQLCLKIRQMHQDFGMMTKELSGVSLSHYMRNKQKFSQFDVVGPGRILLNLEKETDGAHSELRGCLSTYKEALMSRGKHWLKTLRQICIENELFKLLGVVPDWSKGQGGQVESNNRAESESDESESESNRHLNALESRLAEIENQLAQRDY